MRGEGVVAYALGLLASQVDPPVDIRDDIEVFGFGVLLVTRSSEGEFEVKAVKPTDVVIHDG